MKDARSTEHAVVLETETDDPGPGISVGVHASDNFGASWAAASGQSSSNLVGGVTEVGAVIATA